MLLNLTIPDIVIINIFIQYQYTLHLISTMVCHSPSKNTHMLNTYSCVTAYIKLRTQMKLTLLVRTLFNAFTQNHHTSAQAFTCSLEKCVWLLPLSPALLKQTEAQLYNRLYSEQPGGHFRWALPVVLTTASSKKSRGTA